MPTASSQELANLAREYAKEQGYSFVGPVRVRFETAGDLAVGLFRIRSGVIRGATVEQRRDPPARERRARAQT